MTIYQVVLADTAERKAGIKHRLDEAWVLRHKIYRHKDVPKIGTMKKSDLPFDPKACHSLGLCICKPGLGQDSFYFKANMVKILKPFFRQKKKVKSQARLLMEQCKVLLRFKSKPCNTVLYDQVAAIPPVFLKMPTLKTILA